MLDIYYFGMLYQDAEGCVWIRVLEGVWGMPDNRLINFRRPPIAKEVDNELEM